MKLEVRLSDSIVIINDVNLHISSEISSVLFDFKMFF